MIFEVLMGTNIMITVFQDVTPYSLSLREPAASVFRLKAVWKNVVHEQDPRTGNWDSMSPKRRQWPLKVQIMKSSITFPPDNYSSSLSFLDYYIYH
jgi:hypothetical protein